MTRRKRGAVGWLALGLAGPLLVLGIASFVRRITAVEPSTGIDWVQSAAGPVAIGVEPGGAAARAGLRPGDLLLEADGRAVRSALDAEALGWSEAPVALRVRRGGTEVVLALDPAFRPRQEPYGYLALVGVAFWVAGAFIALRWPLLRGGALFPLLALCMFAHLALSPSGRADALDRGIDWADLIAGALAPALLVHLAAVMARSGLERSRPLVASAYGVALASVLAAVWLRPDALGGAYRLADPRLAIAGLERLGPALLGLGWLVATAVVARALARTPSALHRGQLRWMLWGSLLGLGPFVLLYALPWSVGAAELPRWAEFVAVAPMVLLPGALTAALVRYRLHDLDTILVRGFAEVSAVFGSCAVLAGSVFLLRSAMGEFVPLSNSATRYVGFLVAAISYPQMRAWARAGVERAFYRQRYSYRATLLDWARELNAETDLESLLQGLRTRVRETLGIPQAEVLVRVDEWRFRPVDAAPGGPALDLDDDALTRLEHESYVVREPGDAALPWARYLFPLRVKGSLRAVLAAAERPEAEEPLSTEDRALLGTLAAHAATAIEAARLFQEVRRRAEEIERLHSRQAKILESSAVGLLLVDSAGRIQVWNRALEAIWGLPREEAVGRRLSDIFPLHVARRIEREAASAAVGGEARIFRLGMVNRRERRLLVNLSISPPDDAPDGGGRVVTFDDVTARVELEEQMLRQERLASLGLLAAGVAHEINTPLTGISSYTQMLLEGLDDADPRRRVLQKIEQQTERAAAITAALLNLARPEDALLEPLDLNRTVEEVLQLFEPQLRRTGVRLRTALGDDLPAVRGNKGKLQQVLLNLLLNARDAVDRDGNISVVTSRAEGRAVIEVTDDGVGIAEEDLSRIFDPFFTTKGRGAGTGLGLSISYGIVREHRGEIRVESQPGRFTRFRVELPAAGTARALA